MDEGAAVVDSAVAGVSLLVVVQSHLCLQDTQSYRCWEVTAFAGCPAILIFLLFSIFFAPS